MERVDDIMREYAGDDRPGASVLVVRADEVVFMEAYGMADLENTVRATPATAYRLASVTKQFTAAMVLHLAALGRLALDDRVRAWLPSLPPEYDNVTLHHLLTHTSGLVDYEEVMEGVTTQLHDRDVLRLLVSRPHSYFAPGTGWRYSNSGYALLALVVEEAAERSFAESLQKDIFEPLGMRTTLAYTEGAAPIERRAFGYSHHADGWSRTDQDLTSAVLGDGGVYSSVDDLCRWLMAVDRGAFGEAAVPRVATDVAAVQYGYGWRVSEHHGRRIVHHTGETIGFRNAVLRFPDERLAVVVLTNRSEGDPMALAIRVSGLCGT